MIVGEMNRVLCLEDGKPNAAGLPTLKEGPPVSGGWLPQGVTSGKVYGSVTSQLNKTRLQT